MTHTVTLLTPTEYGQHLGPLAELLRDAVDDGASVGFLAGLSHGEAVAWWQAQAGAVAAGSLLVWIAKVGGSVEATVSVALCGKPNGRHRADVVKLMAHRRARGQGLARLLLTAVETAARARGVTLLLLDTETGSAAEHLYQATGWTRFGVVPAYAMDPAGHPRECSFFYKQLD